ncbi:hypothetical protein H6G65_02075 [Microcystis elabens FACHB-917]|nr:hypothetical protein [Microcystis elabens FACHB-917]
MDERDCRKIDEMAAHAVASRSLDTVLLGVKVGRLALYELTLFHKKMSTNLTEQQWDDYAVYLANALRSLQGFARYLDANPADAILTFSPQYSNINPCTQYAIGNGFKVLFLESGNNLSHRLGTLRIWDWGVHRLVNPALRYWDNSRLHPVSSYAAKKIVGHFEQLLSGQHFAVYSAPSGGRCDLRSRWGIKPEQKILLMTLSSYDEAYAALLIDAFPESKVFSDVFRTQAEWVQATLSWITNRPELFLVIRIHPRDFPNKREAMRSDQSFLLEQQLSYVPSNAHVNWPNETISLYQILESTSVVLTGWSVTGVEALALGIPVVTYDANLPSYPRDIHYTGRTEEEYFVNIDKALSDGWRLENSIHGFRWMAYNFVTCTATVSNHFGRYELRSLNLFDRLWKRIWMRIKTKLQAVTYPLDLLRWRDAVDASALVSRMLTQGYDAIPPALSLHDQRKDLDNEVSVVLTSLARLHRLLPQHTENANDIPGLSHNIQHALIRNGRK